MLPPVSEYGVTASSGNKAESFASRKIPPDITKAVEAVPDKVKIPASKIPLEILSSEEVPANFTSLLSVSVPLPDFFKKVL